MNRIINASRRTALFFFSCVALSWLVPATAELHKTGPKQIESLVARIELDIAEYTSGDRSENELRRELANAIRPFGDPSLRIESKTANAYQTLLVRSAGQSGSLVAVVQAQIDSHLAFI